MIGPRTLVSALAAAAVWSAPAAQTPVAGTGVVSGTVISDDESKRPIRRATVALNGGSVTNVLAVTSDDGRFTFRGVPPGRYTLNATRPGYITAWYGATKPGRAGTAIAVGPGQQVSDLPIRMLRGSVIAGTIRNEHGEPVPETRMTVFMRARSAVSGEVGLVGSTAVNEVTDDRGRYRLYGLAPGEYFVVANPPPRSGAAAEISEAEYQRALQTIRGGRAAAAAPTTSPQALVGTAPSFFPGTASVDAAQPIVLGPAEERTGVDFTLSSVPVADIHGIVVGLDGQPAAKIPVNATSMSRLTGPLSRLPLRGTTDADGRFRLAGVPPGSYAVVARSAAAGRGIGPASAPLTAIGEVAVDGRDVAVTLTLGAGVSISGEVSFQGASKPDLSRVRVSLDPAGDSTRTVVVSSAVLDASGAFVIAGVMPGSYHLRVSGLGVTGPAATWFLKAAAQGDRDLIDIPLEVAASMEGVRLTLSDRPAELTGLMQDATGQPAPEYFLVAFPQNEALRRAHATRIQQARPDADGRFRFRGLLPGAYLLAAVTDLQPGEMFDPEFLKSLAGIALRVTLSEGATTTQDIRVK